MGYRKFSFLLFLFCVVFNVFGQSSFDNANPSFVDKGLTISLPQINVLNIFYGPSIGNVLKEDSSGDINFDKENALGKLNTNNSFNTKSSLKTLGFNWFDGRWGFGISHSITGYSSLNYHEDLLNIIANGNAPYIGEQLNIGPKINAQLYHELSYSGNIKVDKLSIGVRLKVLSGLLNLSTESSDIKLTTSDDIYQLEFVNDYVINNAGIIEFEDLENLKININEDLIEKFWSKNAGFSIDLGINYQLDEKWNINAAILDFGSITWRENISNFSNQGSFAFDGIDLKEYVTTNENLSLADSLLNILDFVETENEFKTKLNYQLSAGASHKLNDKLRLSGDLDIYRIIDLTDWTISLGADYKIVDLFSVRGTYLYHRSDPFNLGVYGSLNLGILEIFGGVSDILGTLNVLNKNYYQVNLGMNLKF